MKPIPAVLVNLAVVGVALFAYDHVRDEPGAGHVAPEPPDIGALIRRIETLEAQGRPLLRAPDAVPTLHERLDALESAVALLDATAGSASEPIPASKDASVRVRAQDDEPTPEAIERFRKLRDAARRADRREKSRARIDKMLDTLALNLSDEQRERIHDAQVAFEPRVRQIWTEAKQEATQILENGGTIDSGDVVRDTQVRIRDEFASSLTSIVSQADAEAIAQALHAGK